MIFHVLGCSGAIAAGCRTTAFLLDDDVLIDAGTGVGDLALDALARIDHILISHSHLDHVLSIGLLADSVMRGAPRGRPRADPGARAARDPGGAARAHLQRRDLARLHPPAERRAPGARVHAASRSATCSSSARRAHRGADRRAHRAGGAASRSTAARAAGGSTPATPGRIRRCGSACAGMKIAHLVIETAFSDEERQLAHISRHLCPAALGHELAQLPGSVEVHITHIKPGETGRRDERDRPARQPAPHPRPECRPEHAPGEHVSCANRSGAEEKRAFGPVFRSSTVVRPE